MNARIAIAATIASVPAVFALRSIIPHCDPEFAARLPWIFVGVALTLFWGGVVAVRN